MGSSETLGNGQEKSLSDAEQYAVDMSRRMYAEMKQSQPDASEADIHKTIVSILGYYLGTPGYRLEDVGKSDAKPTEEQRAKLEELYRVVIDGEEKTGWEKMAEEEPETLGNSQEKSLSDAEQYAVDMSRRMYAEMKQSQPDASEADIHKTIVSILGYYLGTPGYRLEDVGKSDAKPTEEQRAKLEELYRVVIDGEE